LLAVTACLKAPIGNPETAKIDPKLVGVWASIEKDKEGPMFVFQPYDKRTYMVGWFGLKEGDSLHEQQAGVASSKNPDDEREFHVLKGWLTVISGTRFVCMEPMFQLDKDQGMKPQMWFAWKIDLKDDRLTLHLVEEPEAGKTTKEIETYMRRKIQEGTLKYGEEPSVLTRVPQSDYDKMAEILKRFGLIKLN